MNVHKKIELARSQGWKICAYGLGQIGTNFADECLSFFSLKADLYSDKNEIILNRYDKKSRITIIELTRTKEDVLVVVFLGKKQIESAMVELQRNPHLHLIAWQELTKCDEVICKYFGINDSIINIYPRENIVKNAFFPNAKKDSKIAIFTCITNGYDPLTVPEIIEDNCDYYLITDIDETIKIENDEYYKRINILDVVPGTLNTSKAQNRYCKAHGFEIFKEYDYSIYIDGSLKIIGKVSNLINKVGKYGIAFHRFTGSDDTYEHALSLAIRSRIKREDACVEIQKFAKEGFPRNYGFPECGVIICDHGNEIGKKILCEWNDYYNNALAKRDQLYMPYILWRRNISINEVCTLPGDLRTNGYFKMISFHEGFQA